MNKYLSAVLVVGLLFVMACSGGAANVKGVYEFDTDAWTQKMKEANPNFANTPSELVNKMLEGFKTFTIEVKDGTAVANFGNMVVSGKLEKVSDSGGTITLKMTPTETDKQNQPIMLKITGSKMAAGPENKPDEWLYFKKK